MDLIIKNNNVGNLVNTKKCKLFVGNVPYKCTKSEFSKCFENIKGFVDADVIVKHDLSTSRGFGFVTFNTKQNANDALMNNNYMFKDRMLRLSEYNLETKKYQNMKSSAIFIKNLHEDTTRDDIYTTFSKYGTIVKCFINTNIKTGKLKNNGIVELDDDVAMNNLINDVKSIELINGNVVSMHNWDNKSLRDDLAIKIRTKHNDAKDLHRMSFNTNNTY